MRHKNLRRGIIPSVMGGETAFILSGAGYFGSTYKTLIGTAGNWQANGVDIPGATSDEYVMTSDYDGQVITFKSGSVESNGIQMFAPGLLSPLGWFDASLASTFTLVGAAISEWRSRVGSLYYEQATSGLRPQYSATGRNGLPAVMTSGAAREMTMVGADATLPIGTETSHSFILAHCDENANTWRILTVWNGRYHGRGGVSGGPVTFTLATAPTNNYTGLTWNLLDRIAAMAMVSTRSTVNVDGGADITLTVAHNSAATADYLFRGTSGSQNWIGSVQDMSFFDFELTLDQQQQMEGYLAHKWGKTANLPSGHPYKVLPPRLA